jgi:transcriptional regulator GlxA family with amidase domain
MKHVIIVIPNNYADLTSVRDAFEILQSANQQWMMQGNARELEIHIAGFTKEIKIDSCIFAIYPENLEGIHKCDLVIIPSVSHYYNGIVEQNEDLIAWIQSRYKGGAEVASICTGAFILAATGLLTGKSCATHWGAANDFRKMYPRINLQTDPTHF